MHLCNYFLTNGNCISYEYSQPSRTHSKFVAILKSQKRPFLLATTLEVVLVSPSNFDICWTTLLTHAIWKKLKKSYKIEVALEKIVLLWELGF